jgi:hypothetical protein
LRSDKLTALGSVERGMEYAMARCVKLCMGIDVQLTRGLAYCVLDAEACMARSGWVTGGSSDDQCQRIRDVIADLSPDRDSVAVGIDAPRMPRAEPRAYYWNRARKSWRPRAEGEKGDGRHCEVVICALRLANPQWTPLVNKSPAWMRLGFSLYAALEDINHLYEVFPSASYIAFEGKTTPKITLDFASHRHGPKDMLDACVAALTVHEFVNGRGWEAGGGDGLGAIILPGTVPAKAEPALLQWPAGSIS